MAAMENPLITNAGRIAAADTDSVGDVTKSAQLGIGNNLPNIDGVTPLVMMPIVPILIHAPTMFEANKITNANRVLKSLIERHAKEISGIDFGYQMETATTPAGHDGQELHMPTNARRTPVNPSFTYPEIVGNLVWNFHRNWLHMVKMPDTQASSIAPDNPNAQFDPMLLSYFTMDILFIQYDTTMRPENIIDAFFIANMMPTETGMLGAKKQVGHSEMMERTIQYTGIVQHNRNTKIAGQMIAEVLGLHNVNYNFSQVISTSIEDDVSNMGMHAEAISAASSFLSIA